MKAVKGVANTALGFIPGGNLIQGGLALAGGLLGGKSKPQQVNTPQSLAGSAFSDLLRTGMGGTDIMGQLTKGFTLPGYGGSFGAGVTPEMLAAIQGGMGGFNDFMSGDRGASAINALTQIAGGGQPFAPQGMEALLANLPGQGALAGIAGGTNPIIQQIMALSGGGGGQQDIISRLLGFSGPSAPAGLANVGATPSAGEQGLLGANTGINMGSDLDVIRSFISQQNPFLSQVAGAGQIDTPERRLLLQAAGMDPTAGGMSALGGATDIIGQLMSTPALQSLMSTGGFDPASIFASLDTQRRAGLARDERDIREQLGTSGLRFSTNLADMFQTGRRESEANMMAEIARLMPQYGQVQQQGMSTGIDALLRAAQSMTGVGQTAGQLGLGRQQNVLSGLGSAGELGLGAGRANIDALIAAMTGAGQQTAQQQGAATGAAGLNLDAQSRSIQNLLTAMQGAGGLANQRTGMGADALSSLGNLNLGSSAQVLQALLGAGTQNLQGQGQQGDILSQLLGIQSNAAGQMGSQALQGQDILARLFGQQQSNRLGAATALPGAISSLAGLPLDLAQQMFNLSGGARNIEDQIMQRQYTDFLNQRQMLPNIFSILGGMPSPAMAPSGFQQTMSGATDILTLIETLRNMGQ